MKAFLATTFIVTGSLLAGGCATKKYVRNTTAPIQAKVDQVGEQTNQNSTQIQDTRNQVKQVDDKATAGISAAQERAATADQHAGEAMASAKAADQKAVQAGQTADQAMQGVSSLRGVIANLDDYKQTSTATVPFKFGSFRLTDEGKADLDKLAKDVSANKRFFIAVEGHTDSVGGKEFNEELSRKRADEVVNYLVAKQSVPIYRIHMVGLGKDMPADEGKGREARAKNRRVEVKVYSADQVTASLNSPTNANRAQDNK